MQGVVKWFDSARCFGFIGIEGEKDVFFHIAAVSVDYKNPDQGDHVEFDVVPDSKSGRNKAINVKLVEAA